MKVTGKPGMGKAPAGMTEVASVSSAPLVSVLRRQNLPSDNYYAETLGKLLGATAVSRPGTIAKGAQAIDKFAAANDAPDVTPFDSSGLSYNDRVTADNVVRLLWYTDTQTWADDMRSTLAAGGQGTLAGRLTNVNVRAKTGTLTGISALSGWVASKDTGDWIEFSILSQGMPKTTASQIEDRIVTINKRAGSWMRRSSSVTLRRSSFIGVLRRHGIIAQVSPQGDAAGNGKDNSHHAVE